MFDNPAFTFAQLREHADAIANDVLALAREFDPTDTGIWFSCWWSLKDEPVSGMVGFPVGFAPEVKWPKYMHFANEKAYRTARHPSHYSSWQSRGNLGHPNPWEARYGGGIRLDPPPNYDMVFAVSGSSEHFDELIAIRTAQKLGVLNMDNAVKIVTLSDNQRYRDYCKLFFGHYP